MYENAIEAMKLWPDWVKFLVWGSVLLIGTSIGTGLLGIDKDRQRRKNKDAEDEEPE